MTDWEVKVRLHSGEIKTCVMEDYITRRDAEAAALNSTGAKSIFTPGTPIGGKGIVVNMDGGVGGSWAESIKGLGPRALAALGQSRSS